MNREIEFTKQKNEGNNKFTIYDLIGLARDINGNVAKYVLKFKCKSLKDIIETNKSNINNNQEYFEVFTGFPFEVYDRMVRDNVICEEVFNEVVDDFWYEYEKAHQYGPDAVVCFYKRWNLY